LHSARKLLGLARFGGTGAGIEGLGAVFVDSGYNVYEWEDYLQEINNLKLQVPRKQNSKRSCEPWLEIHKSLMRKYIKTTIGEIARIVSEKDSCD
jgi:hypothetical protein